MREGLRRYQFDLRTLMQVTIFLGIGIGCALAYRRLAPPSEASTWQTMLLCLQILAAGPFFVAGLLVPFGQACLGAYIGFFAEAVVLVCMGFYAIGWKQFVGDPVIQRVLSIVAVGIVLLALLVWERIRTRASKRSTRNETAEPADVAP